MSKKVLPLSWRPLWAWVARVGAPPATKLPLFTLLAQLPVGDPTLFKPAPLPAASSCTCEHVLKHPKRILFPFLIVRAACVWVRVSVHVRACRTACVQQARQVPATNECC